MQKSDSRETRTGDKLNCRSTLEIKCPHCGYEFKDSGSCDITYYKELIECRNDACKKMFNVYSSEKVVYTSSKV